MKNYSFGNYLCELREKKGLSQSQLGEKLGVTNKAVSRWENGSAYPSTELMLPLAEALGVTIEDLYKVVSESKMPKTKLRSFLEWLMQRSKMITVVCLTLAIVPSVLFALFSSVDGKIQLSIMNLVMGVLVYVAFYLMIILSRRNPFSSVRALDVHTIVMLVVMAVSYFGALRYFIIDFPKGLPFGLCLTSIGFMAIIHTLKRRYK
ncbi:MAG: helix-turn-helix transcriptional regulator [Clostridia bacterium]|nr:helix-turn-helix transcriptional regulator [Clostridia bacterium]